MTSVPGWFSWLDDFPEFSEDCLIVRGLEPGQQVDQFRIVRKLGLGGMSEVYLARDTTLGRKVALKIVRADFADSPRRLKLFLREARLTAKFSHQHIITIYFVGEFEGHPYLALEYLEGQTLSQRMREGAMSAPEVMRVGLAIAQALEEAHSHGVLHLDLKPANVIIPKDGRLRVLDFGISKIVEDSIHPLAPAQEQASEVKPEETVVGEIKGTPAYIAPERWIGDNVTGAADLWALGVILYTMLTQVHPFYSEDRSIDAIAQRIVSTLEPPPLPSNLNVPPELSQLIISILDRVASRRPSVTQVVEVLQELIQRKRSRPLENRNPFRGLLPFSERHADLFFGRSAEIEMAVERLRHEPILPVVGPSGAGKSSFVAAGIVPRLRELESWLVLTVRPGTDPFGVLGSIIQAGWKGEVGNTSSPSSSVEHGFQVRNDDRRALECAADLKTAKIEIEKQEGDDLEPTEAEIVEMLPTEDAQSDKWTSAGELAQKLLESPATLVLELQALADETRSKVLLFVDQLEELYTHEHDQLLCRAYMEAISRAADDPEGSIRVVFTLRDDFLGYVADTPSAREALSRITVLRAPDEEALAEVVTKPVELAGYSYEDEGLPEEMIDAVRGAPASLPILQFACTQLWNRRDTQERLLTRSAYEAMGGVEGALASEADELLAGLSESQRNLVKQLMLRLVTPDGTRRVMAVRELLYGLDSVAEFVLERLTAARIVVSRRAQGRDSAEAELELVHDALIHSWKPLVRWLDQSREEVVFLDEVSRAAELWDSRGRPREEVWSGRALDEALSKIERCKAIPKRVTEFLEAGEVHRQVRIRVRRRIIMAGFSVLLAVIAVLVLMNRQMEIQRERALVLMAEAQEKHDRQQQAHASALREGARAAYTKGDVLEARSKLRGSLETRDSTQARALWWLLENEPLVWSKLLDSFGNRVSVSRDGRLIAVSSKSINIYDTQTLERRVLSGHASQVMSLDFSPNGRWLSSSSNDQDIRLWDLREGTVKVLKGHTNSVRSTAFSPDNKRLVSGSDDTLINIWDVVSGTLVKTLKNDTSVHNIRYSPDGRFVISAHQDQKLHFWNTQNYTLEKVIEEPDMRILDVVTSVDGKLLSFCGDGGIVVVEDFNTRREFVRLYSDSRYVQSLSFSSNGDFLAASTSDGRVLVWDTKNWSLLHQFQHAKVAVRSVSFVPNRGQLVSASDDGKLRLWTMDARYFHSESAGHSSPIYALAFTPDGKTIGTGSAVDGELRLWDVASSQSIHRMSEHGTDIYDIAFNNNGQLLAAGDRSGSIRLYTIPDGKLLKTLLGHRATIASVLFSPNGKQLVSSSWDKTIAFWDLENLILQKTLALGESVHSADIDPHGRLLATVHASIVRVRDIETGQVLRTFSGHTSGIHGLAFSPDGQSLYSSSWDRTVRRYQLRGASTDGEIVARHLGGIYWIDVMYAQEEILGTPSQDRTAKLWKLKSGQVITLKGHHGEVNRLKFSPEGTRVATVSDDNTLRLWDTKTGRPLWHAPLILEQPPLLYTPQGWTSFDDDAQPAPSTKKWQKAVETRGKLASASSDRQTLCVVTSSDEIELWNMPQDEHRSITKLEEVQQILAVREGCLSRSAGELTLIRTTGETIPLGKQVDALNRFNDSVFVLKAGRVHVLDLDGNQQDEFTATTSASSLIVVADKVVLGFPDGRIEIWRRNASKAVRDIDCRGVESWPVTTLIPGPPGTFIAGFVNGSVGIWSIETGERLYSHRLHGPVIHLLHQDQTLWAASELGSRLRLDLSTFYTNYCKLMERVWSTVPWIWEEGRARFRERPTDHVCARSR